MNGLILAAGRGSRLGSLTDEGPKCLIEVNGRSLLSRQVDALKRAGVDSPKVVTGWKSERVRALGYETIENTEWDRTSMVGSLTTARDVLLRDVTLVSYGDIIYGASTAGRLAKSPHPLAISYDPDWLSLWSKRFANPLDDAETFSIDGARYYSRNWRTSAIAGRSGWPVHGPNSLHSSSLAGSRTDNRG